MKLLYDSLSLSIAMNRNNRTHTGRMIHLQELPVSSRTIKVNDDFMISDNLGEWFRDGNIARDVMPMFNTPLRLRFTMMLLCLSGSMRLNYRMEEHIMRSGDMLLMLENSIAECLDISEDAIFIMMSFSDNFNIMDTNLKPSADTIARITGHPLITLSAEEAESIKVIYHMLRSRLEDPAFPFAREFSVTCMRTAFCYISHYYASDLALARCSNTRKEILLDRFMRLVEEYAVKEHKVTFYADRLCISAKYLSRVVSELSGKSPREWIAMRIIMEAKAMLNENQLTVAQISDALCFPSQSFFGTFFKHHTGLSPWNYRRHTL